MFTFMETQLSSTQPFLSSCWHWQRISCHRHNLSFRHADIYGESAVIDTTFPFVMLTFMENQLSPTQPFLSSCWHLWRISCHRYNRSVVLLTFWKNQPAITATTFRSSCHHALLENRLLSIQSSLSSSWLCWRISCHRYNFSVALLALLDSQLWIDTQPSMSWRISCHLYKLPCRLGDTLGESAVIYTTFRSSWWHSWKINCQTYNFPVVLLTLLENQLSPTHPFSGLVDIRIMENQRSSVQSFSRLVDTLGESAVSDTTFSMVLQNYLPSEQFFLSSFRLVFPVQLSLLRESSSTATILSVVLLFNEAPVCFPTLRLLHQILFMCGVNFLAEIQDWYLAHLCIFIA